jgi:hypothetical protein
MKKKQIALILLAIFLPIAIFITAYNWKAFTRGRHEKVNTNQVLQNISLNQNQNVNTAQTNENVNADTGLITDSEVAMTGRVFIKGYGTASESYGILSTDGNEVGLGSYDSMKEQFRAYVNDQVTVTFSRICRATAKDCCLTLYYYCGTVKTFTPAATNTNQ